MKNVTIALDEETHRAARIRAAELGTSLSAMVKDYLQSLNETPTAKGVREMPMTFAAQPGAIAPASVPNPNNAPYFVDGKWVFTPDGKPRKPGGWKTKATLPDDWDEWSPDMLGFFDKLQNEDWDDSAFDPLP